MENSFCVETLRGDCGFPTRSEDVKSDKNIRLARLQTRWVARKLGKGIDDDDDDDLSLSLEDDRFDEDENWEGVGRIFVSSWPLSLSLFFIESRDSEKLGRRDVCLSIPGKKLLFGSGVERRIDFPG